MARPSKLWLRKQTGEYHTTVHGKRHRLGKDKAEAERAFHALLAQVDPAPGPAVRMTFRKLADLYLAFTEATKSKRTFDHQLHFLKSFVAVVKNKAVVDLKPADVTAWMLANKTNWGHNSQVTGRGVLRACLNWGVFEGHIAANPLARVKTGQVHRRERILTKDEADRIIAAVAYEPFKNFLTFLTLTGCRPFSEAAQVTAQSVDWAAGTITFKEHKNARKGKSRVVYLVPELQALLKEWCAATPTGPLFRTPRGFAYNRSNVTTRLKNLVKRLGVEHFSLYSFRHTYFTAALEKGVPVELLAELGGNSPRTLVKFYSHLDQRKKSLAEAAAKAVS